MKLLKFKLFVSLFLFLGIQGLFAQEGLIVLDSTAKGQIKFAVIDENCYEKNTQNSLEFLKAVLKPNAQTDFYLYNLVEDETGGVHEKYQQTFNGLKVEFGEYIVHKDPQGNITSINGDFMNIPERKIATVASRSLTDVVKKVTAKRDFAQYQLADLPTTPYLLKSIPEDTKSETVLIHLNDSITYLTYKVNMLGTDLTDNFIAYIDIQTGEIVHKSPLIKRANYNGTAQTRYSGTQTIITENYNGGYRLRETNRGGTSTTIHTVDHRNTPDLSTSAINAAVDFIDNDNNWTAAEYNNSRKNNAALDVHWGAEKTFDYFLSVHNRKSFDNKNGIIKSHVHVGNQLADAFFHPGTRLFFYGDGPNNNPYVGLDVIAHEIAHGICETSVGNGSGLLYQGESGALNESLSDIWAACVKQRMAPNKNIWLMCEEFIPDGMRSMSDPKSLYDPNTYQGQYWVNTTSGGDNGGVHTNSGVGNYWFYLLSQGGSGTNDKGKQYNIQGIGIDKAAKIVYQMETTYLTYRSTYADARQASLSAAQVLYGYNSQEYISIQNAWYAVGIGDHHPTYIQGSKNICINSLSTYTLHSLQGTVPADRIIWSCSSNLQIQNGSTGNSKTFKGISNGKGWVRAECNYNGIVFNAYFALMVGIPPNPTGIIGFREDNQIFGPGGVYSFEVSGDYIYPSELTFNWHISGGRVHSSHENGVQIQMDHLPPGEKLIPFQIYVTVSNPCGYSQPIWKNGYVGSNPIELRKENTEETPLESDIVKIKIYNIYTGELVYEENNPEKFNIDKTNISKGIYILEKIDKKGNCKTEKVTKQKL